MLLSSTALMGCAASIKEMSTSPIRESFEAAGNVDCLYAQVLQLAPRDSQYDALTSKDGNTVVVDVGKALIELQQASDGRTLVVRRAAEDSPAAQAKPVMDALRSQVCATK